MYLPLLVIAVGTGHLVAAVLLDKRMLTFIALPDERCGHRFFDDMP